jgi:hypothetical protein
MMDANLLYQLAKQHQQDLIEDGVRHRAATEASRRSRRDHGSRRRSRVDR